MNRRRVNRRLTVSSLVVALSLTSPVWAATGRTEVFIRLVDAASGTPLEFWEKTVEPSKAGPTLHWRMPKTVYVDGQPWRYARYGGQGGNLTGQDEEAAPKGWADLERELGATGSAEGEVRSDRAAEIQAGTGLKALVTGSLEDGDHILLPGGVRFRLQKGEVVEVDGGLRKSGPTSLRLQCFPVDLNFPALLKPGTVREITCLSGSNTVFGESFTDDAPLALRLFLPASAVGYTVKASAIGAVTFTLDDKGVHVQGPPVLNEGLLLTTNRFTLGVVARTGSVVTAPKPVSPADGPELYLFTDRHRQAFVEGETVALSVRAWGEPQGDDKVTLVLDEGTDSSAVDLAPQTLIRTGSQGAAELELATAMLRPGKYRVHGRWGKIASSPMALEIAPLMPETNMKLFGFTKWSKGSYDPKDLAALPRSGLNLLVATGSDKARSPMEPAGPGGQAKSQAPPERLEARTEQEAGADFLLAHGIENVPVASGLILYFNVGEYWRSHADDHQQSVQHLGQEWRRYPNFRGIVHCTGDGPTPATMGMVWAAGAGAFDVIHDQRVKKLREVFDFKVGKLKVDDAAAKAEFERINSRMQGAVGFGVGMDASLKVEGSDAIKFAWARWINDLYPACFREERKALAALIDNPIVNCSHSWGTGAGCGMWEETFYRDQDNPVVDIHGDYGIMPLSYSSGSDTLCMGSTNRPWITLDLLPERPLANGLKLFLEGLSRNPAGIGALDGIAGGWSLQKDPSERMTVVMNLGRRFGDVFASLRRRDEIAVLASMRQDAVAGQSEAAIWGAHFLATKAGYQVNVITEEECLRDPATLKRFKAVLLPGMTAALPSELSAQLARFQAEGGLLISDDKTTAEPPGAIKVQLADMLFANQVDFREAYNRFEPLIQPFRDRVGAKLTPFFSSSVAHVHLVRSVDEDLEYWTLFNDTLLTPAENPNGHFIQFLYKGVETELKAGRNGVLYDVFRRSRVETRKASTLAWRADLRYLPGTVYLCADRPIASLSVTAPRRATRASLVHFKAAALDAEGQAFTGKLPVELAVTDPSGAVRYRLYRTTNRDVLLKIAANDPAGRWTWTVTDQATGLAAAGDFTVEGETAKPSVQSARDLVFDGWAIGQALRERPFEIVLYPDQMALKEVADALASSLQQAGAKASVRLVLPSAQRLFPMNWNTYTVEDEEIQKAIMEGEAVGLRVRGKNQFGSTKNDPMKNAYYSQYAASGERVLYRNIILLGRGDVPDNPLQDLIAHRTKLLPRNPSPSFPAPGFGLVAYAWGPFHYGHDAIVLYGRDAAGLARATVSLVRLATDPVPPRPVPVWRQPDEYGQSYSRLGLKGGADEAVLTGRERTAESLLPESYDQRIVAACSDAGRLVIRQEPTADPKGPVLATVDLKSGVARRLNSEVPAFRRADLDVLARSDTNRLASPLILQAGPGRILPVSRGLALINQDTFTWFYSPFAVSKTLEEAQFPRLCHSLALSADGQTVAAGFYDLGAGGGYGPKYRQFNAAAVVLLDTRTGREIARFGGYLARHLALTDDGSRCFIIDTAEWEGGRSVWNPHGGPTFAVFDRQGKELFHLPAPSAAALSISGNGKLAVLSYDDTRRYVSVIDVDQRQEIRVDYARIDLGTAVAPDGSFAVITYADGLVRKVAPDGKLLWEQKLPAPGVPVVTADRTIMVCADDGQVYYPETKAAPLAFAAAPIDKVTPVLEQAPAGLVPPGQPFWTTLPGDFKPQPLPPLALPELADFKGEKNVTIEVPRLEPLETLLFTFRYRLKDPSDRLTVSLPVGSDRVSFVYPYLAQSRLVAVPLRLARPGPVVLTFASAGGAIVDQPQVLRLRLGSFANAAAAGVQQKGAEVNTPRVMVPNIHGCLGDPRVEQMAFGFPEGTFKLPADVSAKPKTDAFSYFDGNVYAGTPMYPTVYPGHASWDPADARPTLRSAQIVMEFSKARKIGALGIWEHPNDRPVAGFTLEYAASAPSGSGKIAEKDWVLATEQHDNIDYYHVHVLPQPVAARYWRYTVLETACPVQRVAEIELYESAIDSIEHDLDRVGGSDALPEL
jgi:hypothetical protein